MYNHNMLESDLFIQEKLWNEISTIFIYSLETANVLTRWNEIKGKKQRSIQFEK